MNKSCPKPYQKNNYNTSFYPPVNTTFNLYNLGNLLLMRALMRNLIILTLLLHLNQNQIHHHPLPPPHFENPQEPLILLAGLKTISIPSQTSHILLSTPTLHASYLLYLTAMIPYIFKKLFATLIGLRK